MTDPAGSADPVVTDDDGETVLRTRLREAEATLTALQQGDVDAVVVEGPAGPAVYALRGADEPYRRFVEQMREGAATLGADGLVLFANRGLATLLGTVPDALVAHPLLGWATPSDAPRLEALLARGDGRTTCRLRRSDGETVRVLLSARAVALDDQRVVCVVVTDLSPQDRAELARRERDSAERANRAKDDFLATLSHELRTPLAAIMGWVRVLELAGADPVRRAQAVETLGRNTRALAAMIDDLLDVSRIVAGKLELEIVRLDLAALVTDTVESHRPGAEAAGIALALAVPATPLAVRGDPGRLRQVVGNLLANALKFTARGGRVTVELGRRGAQGVLHVRDTGIGIAPAFVDDLFERFAQADGSSTRRHGGLGLGLAIARHLVERHDGTITAASDGPGCGATFTVTLPLAGEAGAADDADGAPAGMLDAVLDVLLVDDSGDTREALALILADAGARVRTAASVAEALAALDVRRPDVLVSDIGMPEQDGYALIRAVRAGDARHGRRLPTIAMTGFAGRDDAGRALAAGFDRHVPKPVDPDALVAIVSGLARPAATR